MHALKSVSKTIGAMETSELAKELEQAAKDGDTGRIQADHANLIRLYRKTVTDIASAI